MALCTTFLVLLVGEGLSRLLEGARPSAHEVGQFKEEENAQFYEVDPDFGFKPVLDGPHYDARGFLRNEYGIEKDPERERILFIGDSGTQLANYRTPGLKKRTGYNRL